MKLTLKTIKDLRDLGAIRIKLGGIELEFKEQAQIVKLHDESTLQDEDEKANFVRQARLYYGSSGGGM